MAGEAKIIGGFRVLKDLKAGAGSQGTVYQAVCEKPCLPSVAVGDVVALKVMPVQDDDGAGFARLERRTAELVRLDHSNVVRYHGCLRESGPFNDVHVLVLEFVEGRSLRELVDEAPCGLGAEEAMRIAFGLIEGLVYTSSRGIVHRDIKPANVIVQPDGTPKLIDFEVARREDGTATVGGNNMIGTFDYMAPDFTDADFRGDVLSDVFSMGVMLHEMLTGRTPYRRSSSTASQANVAFLQRWIKAGSAANPLRLSPRVGKLLPGAQDVLARTLSPDRSQRIPDFLSLRDALSGICYRDLVHDGRAWRLLNYIGHGGFGEVFRAADRATGAHVAVKHLLNPAWLGRFRLEAEAMRRVSGSCFPQFVDWFTAADGDAFLVMDFLKGMPGLSLKDVLKAKPAGGLGREPVLKAFVRYARGLADLHAIGYVHRDVKPANLYFPPDAPERAVIMDLGIARDVSGTATVGQVPGTLAYMPPECVVGNGRGGPEADVWALGLCLYEALSGKPAYPRPSDGQLAFEECLRRARQRVKPDFSGMAEPGMRALLDEMCALDPEKRIRDVRIVERRLRILNGEKAESLPVPPADFAWREAEGGADLADDAKSVSSQGSTMVTVWCDDKTLACTREIADARRRRVPNRKAGPWLPAAVLLLLLAACGAFALWRHAGDLRREGGEKPEALPVKVVETTDRERQMAEDAAKKAEAERERQAKAPAEKKVAEKKVAEVAEPKEIEEEDDGETLDEVRAELEKLKEKFEAVTAEYRKTHKEAMQSGDLVEAEKMQSAYLKRKKAYKAAKKRLVEQLARKEKKP